MPKTGGGATSWSAEYELSSRNRQLSIRMDPGLRALLPCGRLPGRGRVRREVREAGARYTRLIFATRNETDEGETQKKSSETKTGSFSFGNSSCPPSRALHQGQRRLSLPPHVSSSGNSSVRGGRGSQPRGSQAAEAPGQRGQGGAVNRPDDPACLGHDQGVSSRRTQREQLDRCCLLAATAGERFRAVEAAESSHVRGATHGRRL